MRRFADRKAAGRELATMLHAFEDAKDVIVLALPRGGVPVAFEVAAALHAPLDVFSVRKIGLPENDEYAIGAIATGGVISIDRRLVDALRITEQVLGGLIGQARTELDRRERLYRGNRGPLHLRNRTVIVVDDGLATGATMQTAVMALRSMDPARIVVATPIASHEAEVAVREVADAFVCACVPSDLQSVGQWYEDFTQISDQEVLQLLHRAALAAHPAHRDLDAAGAWYA
jgi:putative phosphoribosyl transferase